MGVWADRILPRITDRALSSPEVMELRAAACAGLAGRVLEIGFGSGQNLPFYPVAVNRVDAVEPADLAWELSARRRAGTAVPVERTGLDGQRLAAGDGQYDAVLSTFTLCTIPDLGRALAEVRRVLRGGGSLHFVEHGRARQPRVVRWQRRLDPLQGRVFGGCHLSRDIPALVEDAGLTVVGLEAAYLPGPAISHPWGWVFRGQAVA
jgi:SAM-dependent methyltransferase